MSLTSTMHAQDSVSLSKLSLLFILLILVGTSTDFIARQFLPNLGFSINVICSVITLASIYIFHKMISQKNSSFVPISSPLINQIKPPAVGLTPLANLINSNDPFLILRFFAAFLVFVTHMQLVLKPDRELWAGPWHVLTGGAQAGMAIFFTLSGFLMGKAFLSGRYKLNREGIITFYKSRWIRIFPLMCFVFLFLAVLQYPEVLRFNLPSIIRLVTFNYYGNTIGLNGIGAMWSLSVECQYYLIAPFIFLLINPMIQQNRNKGILSLISLILFFVLIKYAINRHFWFFKIKHMYDPDFFSLLGNMPFFLIGLLFNYIRVNISEIMSRWIMKSWVLGPMLFIYYLICNYHPSFLNILMISVLTGYIIASLDSIRNTTAFLNLNKYSLFSMLQILGVLSYGFYLWHSGIASIHSKLFPSGFSTHSSYFLEVLIVGIIVLLISLISYILVEDRFNVYKPIHKSNMLSGTINLNHFLIKDEILPKERHIA